MNTPGTYEDHFGRVARWTRRAWRAATWRLRPHPRELLVELRWRLGDELMALPVLHALRRAHPRDHITLWTNFPDVFARAGVANTLNTGPPRVDRYLLLHSGPRQVARLEHYARLAGIPVPLPAPVLAPGPPPHHLAVRIPAGDGPLIGLAPGASWPIKRWPGDHWEGLAQALVTRGARVVGLGTAGESIPGVEDFAGATTPLEAAQILAQCRAAITCDSGLMHLALAVQTPVVALFGPTVPGYLSTSPLLRPVLSALPCQGFWNRAPSAPPPGTCPLGHASCVEDISVEQVLAALEPAAEL
jgi:ADP-heptose:LPS heptosyltransferase